MKLETWIEESRREFLNHPDRTKHRLFGYYEDAYEVREAEPDRSVAILREAIASSERLEEPWWRLFYEKLRLDAQIHFARDFRNTLDPAAHCALELRNPRFAGFPGKCAVQDTLVAVYLGIDAEGYAEAIREMLDVQEREIPVKPCVDRYHWLDRSRSFAMQHEDWGKAQEWAEREIELLAEEKNRRTSQHFESFVYADLCQIAFRRKNWTQLAEFVDKGHESARQAGHQSLLAEIEAWRAVEARYAGQEEVATRTLRDAAGRFETLEMPPASGYFAALYAYHELHKETLDMLQIRDEELAYLADHGQFLGECRLRIDRCRLLLKLHRSADDDLDLARTSAMQLRFPEKYLKIIGRLAHGA